MNEDNSSKEMVNGVNVINNENVNTNNIDNNGSSENVGSADNSLNSTVVVDTSVNQNVSMPDAVNGGVVQNVVSEGVNVGSEVSDPDSGVGDSLNKVNTINDSIIQEVSFPEVADNIVGQNPVSENVSDNVTVDRETVIDADVNVSVEEVKDEILIGSIQEVSVNADSVAFNTLLETEVSDNSVFNKKDEMPKTSGGMKEGQENNVEQKGFPVFMVVIFVILIIGAFFIDKIVVFVNNIFDKEEIVEQSSEKDDDAGEDENEDDKNDEQNQVDFSKLTLNDLDIQMKKEFSDYPVSNYVFSTVIEKNKYIINCVWTGEYDSDYKLVVELDYKDGVLSSSVSSDIVSTDLINWQITLTYVLRSVSKLHGYGEEEINNAFSMINQVDLSLEKDGIDYFLEENDNFVFRINFNKKIVLPSFKNFPLSKSDFKYYLSGSNVNEGIVSFDKGYMYFYYSGSDSAYYFFEKKKVQITHIKV